jgi:hypothetical protein
MGFNIPGGVTLSGDNQQLSFHGKIHAKHHFSPFPTIIGALFPG